MSAEPEHLNVARDDPSGVGALHSVRRVQGFLPIEDYAILGDGRTVALVGRDGRVDWWPVPALDAPPVCASLLDPENGGYFSLNPVGEFQSRRQYVEKTNVLQTEYVTESGTVRVTESLNVGLSGRLPWTELARRIEGISGEVDMCWEFAPSGQFRESRPWVSDWEGIPVIQVGDQMIAMALDGNHQIAKHDQRVSGRLKCAKGQRCLVAAVAADHEPLFFPQTSRIYQRIERTVDSWRSWCANVSCEGPWQQEMVRSALALKTLLYEPDGAIAAAATTSLPEVLGGNRNWDYRFAWVRDSSFVLDAFIDLGLHEEVHRSVTWLIRALGRSAPDLRVFYSLGGEPVERESEVDVPGYRNSRPVRSGNGASAQRQLGTFGDLFDTVHRYVEERHLIDRGTAKLLSEFANRCCDTWCTSDSGMWELDELRHYTISKIGCWVALDRATRLAASGQLPDRDIARWKAEAQAIRSWVEQHCWSTAKGSYSFYAGTDRLDAAVLLAGRTGFDRGPRFSTTVDAVAGELSRGPIVFRFSGMEEEEGGFLACSFWLVEALALLGRIDQAACMMEGAIGLANDVGLLSEEIDPRSRALLGNVPQALSHLALINAAKTLTSVAAKADVPLELPPLMRSTAT